ncbi:N-methyl-L-tryptophan oxidase [Paenibacillus chartarius]|uniref:N-methyl-L-tryptophan oxidase n=1 Tax=Paenibacillus chartarius TaxID=747481 RepID=A0ABV6DTH4_9BACL
MSQTFDVIIVGAGSMGMSAGYYLARRGVRTLMIDAFDPPHEEGSHHGDTRLIRHAYSGGAAYVALALEADRSWRDLEEESGQRLLVRSGVLNMADRTQGRFQQRIQDAQGAGVRVERLDADEINRRWPGIRLPHSYEAMYEPDAGYLHSERCIAAYRKLALAEGAMLLPYTRVQHIEADGGAVRVLTRVGDFAADRLILTAGAWFPSLQPFVTLPIRAVRKTVGWFQSEPGLFDTGAFPGFTLAADNGGYYGFPSIAGGGVKIGRHDGGLPWRPGETPVPFGHCREDESDLRRTLEAFMPQAAGRLVSSAVCKYELTPDEHFIIDKHPAHENVIVAGGFSGHGFKFSSAVGKALAELALGKRPSVDLGLFALSRFDTTAIGGENL